MKKRTVVLTVLILMACATAYGYDDGDFQVWHTEVQEKSLNKNTKLTLEEEFRFGDDASEFYYQHYDVGIAYGVNKNLDLGLNYRQVYEKKNGKFETENRPHINAILKWEMGDFKFEDRSRLQYRHFDYQSDLWQYRNKFTVKFPWKFSRIEIQPYISDEIFLDFRNKSFSRNRFYSGLSMNLTKNLKAEIYYLLQSSRGKSSWSEANVLGTKIKLAF